MQTIGDSHTGEPGRIGLPVLSPAIPAEQATATVGLTIGRERLQLRIGVPSNEVRTRDLLPIFQALAEIVVGVAVREVKEEGKTIQCKAGCGACCRQLVPINGPEAHHLRTLVASMPPDRRDVIEARFAAARRHLQAVGMLERLVHPEQLSGDALRALGLEYFLLGIPCPFLEQESCSIYDDRPIACREYLVTSPAENCARPTAETVDCVPLPTRVSNAVARLGQDTTPQAFPWVPLIVALDWAAGHSEAPPRPGPAWLQQLLELLTGQSLSPDGSRPGPPDQP